MRSLIADQESRKRLRLWVSISNLALVGTILFLWNPAAGAAGPNSQLLTHVTGTWDGFVRDHGGTVHIIVTITPGAIRGTYTIHGRWIPESPDIYHPNGGDWGTGPLIVTDATRAGFSARARLHGYYPTLDVLLRWRWDSHDRIGLEGQRHSVYDGVEQVSPLESMILRRAGDQ